MMIQDCFNTFLARVCPRKKRAISSDSSDSPGATPPPKRRAVNPSLRSDAGLSRTRLSATEVMPVKPNQETEDAPFIFTKPRPGCSGGSVLACLAKAGYVTEAAACVPTCRKAATLGREASNGLPELWDALAKAHGSVYGGTSLAAMAWGGAVARADALLREHGADAGASHNLALRAAAENGQVAALQLLVANGADVHSHADLALRDAAARGSYAVVESLIALGANVHALDDSALRAAARCGHARVVALLLASGADADANCQEPLRLAAAYGHLPVVEALMAGGASLRGLLRFAVEQKQWPVVLLLTQSGADVRLDGDYALRMAATFGELGVVKCLVSRGMRSYEALECAFRNGNARVVEFLAGR